MTIAKTIQALGLGLLTILTTGAFAQDGLPDQSVAMEMAKSENWQDRFVIAMLADAPLVAGMDVSAIYDGLLREHPDNPHIIYRAMAHCAMLPEQAVCSEHSFTPMYQAAAPGDGLPFLIEADIATKQGDDGTLWSALSAASNTDRITSYFGDELAMFLDTLDRHPELLAQACDGEDCGPNGAVAGALGFALAQPDYSFLGAAACARREELSDSQIDHCVKVARLAQASPQYVNASIGVGIELKLQERFIDDPQRVAELEAKKTELEKLARAGQAAQDKLGFIDNEQVARQYIALYAEKGELAAYAAFAEMAGIDVDNPPPYCVTQADYDAAVEMVAPENLHEVDFPPICEQLD